MRFIRLKAKQFGIDPERIGVTGQSDGTHMADFGKDGVGFSHQDFVNVVPYVCKFTENMR